MLRVIARGLTRAKLYRALGLEPGASEQEIRLAYKRLMYMYHPETTCLADKEEAARKLQELRAAHDELLCSLHHLDSSGPAPLFPLIYVEKVLWSLTGCAFLLLLYRMRPQPIQEPEGIQLMAANNGYICSHCGHKVDLSEPHSCY